MILLLSKFLQLSTLAECFVCLLVPESKQTLSFFIACKFRRIGFPVLTLMSSIRGEIWIHLVISALIYSALSSCSIRFNVRFTVRSRGESKWVRFLGTSLATIFNDGNRFCTLDAVWPRKSSHIKSAFWFSGSPSFLITWSTYGLKIYTTQNLYP